MTSPYTYLFSCFMYYVIFYKCSALQFISLLYPASVNNSRHLGLQFQIFSFSLNIVTLNLHTGLGMYLEEINEGGSLNFFYRHEITIKSPPEQKGITNERLLINSLCSILSKTRFY